MFSPVSSLAFFLMKESAGSKEIGSLAVVELNELSLKTTDYPTAEAFDAEMLAHFHLQQLAVHLDGPTFGERIYSQGTREWNDSPDIRLNPGFRIKNWTFDSQTGVILTWDHSKVVPTSVPIALIRSTEMRFDGTPHTDQEIWDGQPRGQSVKDLQFDLQFSEALPKWKAAGQMLRIGAVAFAGHQAAIERCHLTDWGAWGYEGFPLAIMGASGPDKNAIARLDPTTHIFDQGVTDSECSHITDCIADGFDEKLSNDQVTVRMITGSMGCPTGDLRNWVQTSRAYAYQRGNRTVAQEKNMVQGHTIYNSLRGDIDHNTSSGCAVGVYGDFCKNKGLRIWLNEFLDCDYAGIRFFLSPGDPKALGNLAEQFSHEDYDIGINKITSRSGVQVDFGTFEDQLPLGPTRYMRNMKVDASLLLEVKGTVDVIRTGQAMAAAGGCRFNPFR